jgi:hypothetical protein
VRRRRGAQGAGWVRAVRRRACRPSRPRRRRGIAVMISLIALKRPPRCSDATGGASGATGPDLCA